MRVLNLKTKGSLMIPLSKSDVIVKALTLSPEFLCTNNTLKTLVSIEDYQNKYRFVMDAAERVMLTQTPVLPFVLVTDQEAKEILANALNGKFPPRYNILGKLEDGEVAEPEKESEKVKQLKVTELPIAGAAVTSTDQGSEDVKDPNEGKEDEITENSEETVNDIETETVEDPGNVAAEAENAEESVTETENTGETVTETEKAEESSDSVAGESEAQQLDSAKNEPEVKLVPDAKSDQKKSGSDKKK